MLHISLIRLAAFLVQERPLDDEEHAHLIRCDQCQEAMGDARLEEPPKKEPPSEDKPPVKEPTPEEKPPPVIEEPPPEEGP
jgi:outer membrane biosynthesis protein TonB